jgi:curved DNA-binding protein CbpA
MSLPCLLRPAPRLLQQSITLPPQTNPFSHRLAFHSTSFLSEQNHYQTLEIAPTASPSTIKKSFYTLSKRHHPDLNPTDPTASTRFLAVSEAYHILSVPSKRAAYDRSIAVHHAPAGHKGSYSSRSGARPATGLSKRRAQFRGPPDSFYAQGGYGHGGQSARRAAQAEETADKHRTKAGHTYTSSPYSEGDADFETSHWDREGHFRTHQGLAERYTHRAQENKQRKRREAEEEADTRDAVLRFAAVSAVVAICVAVPVVWRGVVGEKRIKKDDGG